MNRILFSVALAASIIVGAAALGAAGGNGPPAPTVTPSEVLPGEAVTVSGEGCLPPIFEGSFNGELANVDVDLVGPQPGGDIIASVTGIPAAGDGSWSTGPITIPSDAAPGDYDALATCNFLLNGVEPASFQQIQQGFQYPPAPFVVLELVEEEEPPAAAPAEAVAEEPTFTG